MKNEFRNSTVKAWRSLRAAALLSAVVLGTSVGARADDADAKRLPAARADTPHGPGGVAWESTATAGDGGAEASIPGKTLTDVTGRAGSGARRSWLVSDSGVGLPALGGPNSGQPGADGGGYGVSGRAAGGDSPKEGEYTQEQITEMMNNPLGELWMLYAQNDTTWYEGDALDFLGEGKKLFNTTTLMPVMPMQLTKDYKSHIPHIANAISRHFLGG